MMPKLTISRAPSPSHNRLVVSIYRVSHEGARSLRTDAMKRPDVSQVEDGSGPVLLAFSLGPRPNLPLRMLSAGERRARGVASRPAGRARQALPDARGRPAPARAGRPEAGRPAGTVAAPG